MRKLTFKEILFSLVLVAFSFYGCSDKAGESGVTVTIEPLRYFIDRLTGEEVDVNVMVPMGASPATYSPTSNQFVKVASSALYVGVGHLGFEKAWMNRLKEQNQDMKIHYIAEGVSLIRGEEEVHGNHVHRGGVDPHVWMSPKVVLKFLPDLKSVLISRFPGLKTTIEDNYSDFFEEVEALDKTCEQDISGLQKRKFMIFHPALSYFARDYGLIQIPIEFEGKEPSPQKLRSLIDVANSENINLIFIQGEFDKKNAEMVREATNAELVVINPLAYDWPLSIKNLLSFFNQHLTS